MAARKKRPKSRRYGPRYYVIFVPERNKGGVDHFYLPARNSKSARRKALKNPDVYKVISARKIPRTVYHKSSR